MAEFKTVKPGLQAAENRVFEKKTSSYPVISFSGKSRAALPSSDELHGRT